MATMLKQGNGEIDDDGRLCVLWPMEELAEQIYGVGFDVLRAQRLPSFDEREITWLQVLARPR